MPAKQEENQAPQSYRGRFAPSPTGPLHLGSLLTALASFLQARSRGGKWFVRIDDIDTPRCKPGAATEILRTLEWFGLYWDGPVLYQQQNLEAYQWALDRLIAQGWIYPCTCSRKQLAPFGQRYPGLCRNNPLKSNKPHAFRVKTAADPIRFYDGLQGNFTHNLNQTCGDFIIRRRDKIFAYQLTVVIDDHLLGVTEVLRGCDLLDSTPRQIYLHQLLQLQIPSYCHIPILTDSRGLKLSKQTQAPAVDPKNPGPTLHRLLQWLGQNPPEAIKNWPATEIIAYAITHWNPTKMPKTQQIDIMTSIVGPNIKGIKP